MSGHGTVETANRSHPARRAVDFVEKPLSLASFCARGCAPLDADGTSVRTRARCLAGRPSRCGARLRCTALREQVQQIAPHDTPVLLLGEPGTGRESVLAALHSFAERRRRGALGNRWPNLTIAVAGSLTEDTPRASCMAAHGARSKPGLYGARPKAALFSSAGSRICPPAVQRMLAADLESGTYVRAGGTQPPDCGTARAQPDSMQASRRSPSGRSVVAARGSRQIPPAARVRRGVPELLVTTSIRLADRRRLPLRRLASPGPNRLRHYPWPGEHP